MNGAGEDSLDEYLQGSSEVSRIYRSAPAHPPPGALDRQVLAEARTASRESQYRITVSFAASVLLALAVVFALTVVPRTIRRGDDGPRFMRTTVRNNEASAMRLVYPTLKAPIAPTNLAPGIMQRSAQLYSSDPAGSRASGDESKEQRDVAAWLASIAALRDAGRSAAADAELQRLRAAYPNYAAAGAGTAAGSADADR